MQNITKNQVNRGNATAIWEVRGHQILQIQSVKTAIKLGKSQGILIGGNPVLTVKSMHTSTAWLLRGLSLPSN